MTDANQAIKEVDQAINEMLLDPCYAEVDRDEFASDVANMLLMDSEWTPAVKKAVRKWYGLI